MDEPVLGTGLFVWPLALFTHDAIVLFNVARLFTWILTGLFTWRLAREFGSDFWPAAACGAFFAFSPIRVDQIAHLSTLGTQWIPLVYLFAWRFFVKPSAAHAALTGLCFALSVLACGYHGVFFALLLPLSLAPLALPRLRALRSAPAALLISGAILAPVFALHQSALRPLAFERSAADTLKFAASLETFLAANQWNRTWGDLTEPFRGHPNNLFPGLVVTLAAVAALSGALRRSETPPLARDFRRTIVLLVAAAALVSLGPEIRWRGETLLAGPYAVLREWIPMYANVRATSRAGIFVAFGLALLAAAWLRSLPRARNAVSVIVLVVFMLESRIAPIPTPAWSNVIDSRDEVPAHYAWLRDRAPADSVVAEYPMRPPGDLSRPGVHDSIYMVWSTVHWRPLVNGFAGVDTPAIRRLRASASSFPDEMSLADLRVAGVTHVVIHRRGFGPAQRARLDEGLARHRDALLFEAGDERTDAVYRLEGASTTRH